MASTVWRCLGDVSGPRRTEIPTRACLPLPHCTVPHQRYLINNIFDPRSCHVGVVLDVDGTEAGSFRAHRFRLNWLSSGVK
jgi:hypothetical protein